MNKTGVIYGINGPVIYLKGDPGFKISEMVYVGHDRLVGEVIGLKKGMTIVQVFEETTGLRPGETVTGTGDAISVLLGPGIIHNIFDGIQRPLEEIAKASGKYISRGVSVDSLDTEKKWKVHLTVKEGDLIGPELSSRKPGRRLPFFINPWFRPILAKEPSFMPLWTATTPSWNLL